MTKLNKDWFYAALIRAARTMAQTALGMLSVGLAIKDVDWMNILSVAVVSGVYSILTSIATDLPEVNTVGTFNIDTTDPNTDRYLMNFDVDLEDLRDKNTIVLKVNPDAILAKEEDDEDELL